MDWFRYHTETIDNVKIQSLPPQIFMRWVNFMCLQRIYGTLPEPEIIAFRLRTSPVKAVIWLQELVDRNLVDKNSDGTYTVHDWDEHQFVSDDAAERKRLQRQREKQRKDSSRDMSRDTARDTSRVGPVVEQNRTEQIQSRVDTDTERACDIPVLNGRIPLQQRRAADMDPGEQPSQRFEEFWGAYPRKFDRDSACRDWISVVTVGNEQRVFACLRRYQASDEVRRGVVMNAGSSMRDVGWIIRCHRDGWESDWPAARTQEVKLSRVESVVEEAKRLGRKAC